jgi:predicted membrane-bound spermidine synthase
MYPVSLCRVRLAPSAGQWGLLLARSAAVAFDDPSWTAWRTARLADSEMASATALGVFGQGTNSTMTPIYDDRRLNTSHGAGAGDSFRPPAYDPVAAILLFRT